MLVEEFFLYNPAENMRTTPLAKPAVALVAALHPELFDVELAAADIELAGELTTGATVFDRRRIREWRTNLAVATKVDVAAARDYILRGIAAAGETSADRPAR